MWHSALGRKRLHFFNTRHGNCPDNLYLNWTLISSPTTQSAERFTRNLPVAVHTCPSFSLSSVTFMVGASGNDDNAAASLTAGKHAQQDRQRESAQHPDSLKCILVFSEMNVVSTRRLALSPLTHPKQGQKRCECDLWTPRFHCDKRHGYYNFRFCRVETVERIVKNNHSDCICERVFFWYCAILQTEARAALYQQKRSHKSLSEEITYNFNYSMQWPI